MSGKCLFICAHLSFPFSDLLPSHFSIVCASSFTQTEVRIVFRPLRPVIWHQRGNGEGASSSIPLSLQYRCHEELAADWSCLGSFGRPCLAGTHGVEGHTVHIPLLVSSSSTPSPQNLNFTPKPPPLHIPPLPRLSQPTPTLFPNATSTPAPKPLYHPPLLLPFTVQEAVTDYLTSLLSTGSSSSTRSSRRAPTTGARPPPPGSTATATS